jgi:hypothetical protein
MTLLEQVKDIFDMRDQIDSRAITIAFIAAALAEMGVDAGRRVLDAMREVP